MIENQVKSDICLSKFSIISTKEGRFSGTFSQHFSINSLNSMGVFPGIAGRYYLFATS